VTRVALTGASGFLGGALVNALRARGASVRALVRNPSAIADADVEIVKGDLDDPAALAMLAEGAEAFIHLAGVTHARDESDYVRVNVGGAARAAEAAARHGARFAHASSISARAPALSPYAASKRASEEAVARACAEGSWIALRLPAIYGPRDRATLPYFRLVARGLALEPATARPARASLLYVDDAAEAMATAALDTRIVGVFEVGDDTTGGREWREIGAALASAMGIEARAIRAPRAIVAAAHLAQRAADRALRRTPSARSGQVNEFFHDDWSAGEPSFARIAPWRPRTALHEGFAKTLSWYQEHGLLPQRRPAGPAGG